MCKDFGGKKNNQYYSKKIKVYYGNIWIQINAP